VHGGQVPCKHLVATALLFATRRAPRVPIAGDPIAHRGRLRELEDRLRHEDLPVEEWCELADEVNRIKKGSLDA
jgi:hypothetical protein